MDNLHECAYGKGHSLIVVKWSYPLNSKQTAATSKHAMQLMCENCFTTFNFQEIEKFHLERLRRSSGTVEADSDPVEQTADSTEQQNSETHPHSCEQ